MQITRQALAASLDELAAGQRWVPRAKQRILQGVFDDHCERILTDPLYVAEIESDGRMDG